MALCPAITIAFGVAISLPCSWLVRLSRCKEGPSSCSLSALWGLSDHEASSASALPSSADLLCERSCLGCMCCSLAQQRDLQERVILAIPCSCRIMPCGMHSHLGLMPWQATPACPQLRHYFAVRVNACCLLRQGHSGCPSSWASWLRLWLQGGSSRACQFWPSLK